MRSARNRIVCDRINPYPNVPPSPSPPPSIPHPAVYFPLPPPLPWSIPSSFSCPVVVSLHLSPSAALFYSRSLSFFLSSRLLFAPRTFVRHRVRHSHGSPRWFLLNPLVLYSNCFESFGVPPSFHLCCISSLSVDRSSSRPVANRRLLKDPLTARLRLVSDTISR